MKTKLVATFAVLAAGLAAVAATAPGGRAGSAAAASNSVTFPDSAGEDAAAPDVTSVTVSNDDRGTITFSIPVANRPTLDKDMAFIVFVDADANPATGSADLGGSDYVLELDGPLEGPAGVTLFRWDGSNFTASGVKQTSLVYAYANGATLTISAAELGATKRFNFFVVALAGLAVTPTGELDDTNSHFDAAPDPGHGSFTFDVKTPPPSLVGVLGRNPVAPKAGKALSVFLDVTRSDTGQRIATGTVTCRATVGTAALRGFQRFSGGRGTCTFTVPAKAKGKTVHGTIAVRSGGLTISRSFSLKVR